MTLVPRYLTAFHPKELPHYFTDVLILGGGLAGLRAALSVPEDLHVLLLTKEGLEHSSSQAAQGGIASVMDPEDRFESHEEDTLRAGAGLCDPEVVRFVVREAPRHIHQLIEWGARFDHEGGLLALGREGGHSHHRVVHALGDATGREVMRTVIAQVQQRQHVRIWNHAFALDLLTHQGRCCGALVWTPGQGRALVWAKQTILCAGGAGQIYRETTNPAVATGDGMAIAYRAGAQLRDMEFMQFHPTVLYIAGSSRTLITEALRGEGAYLVDRFGHRFMPEYDSRAELAPRDVVSRAIVAQMEKTGSTHVFLDLSHLAPERIRQRFPGLVATCARFNLDVSRDRIPVRPAAHYMIGGVVVDRWGRTSLPGLWAAGEVTSSGLHGANRLASNSLLESLVYGAQAGQGAAEAAREMPPELHVPPLEKASPPPGLRAPLDVEDLRRSLQALMWRQVGIRRRGPGLEEALETIADWGRYVWPQQLDSPRAWELQNMLTVAYLVTRAALERQESRGVHYREDYPEPDPQWQRHQVFCRREEESPL